MVASGLSFHRVKIPNSTLTNSHGRTLYHLAVVALLLMGMNILKWLGTAYFISLDQGVLLLAEPSWVYLGEFVFVAILMFIIIIYVVKKL